MIKKCTIIVWGVCVISRALIAQNDMDPIQFGNYRIIKSEILGQDRELYVSLPQGYEASTESYPVVFQLYGHFLETYYLPAVRTARLMERLGEAPGVIVVGVKNREFRYRDLLPVDHNQTKSEIDSFLNFFRNELVPFVEKNYRCNSFRILAGPQAGAAFGIYSLAKKPSLFDAYLLSSPFWITNSREILLEQLRKSLRENDYQNKFVMVTMKDRIGGMELQYNDTLRQLLTHHPGFEYVFNRIESNSEFTTPVGMIKGMRTLFREYKFPGTNDPKELKEIESYYSNLSDKYGYAIRIPQHGLVFEGDKFFQNGELEKAKEIFQKMYELDPTELMAFDRLGKVALEQGEYEKARKFYNLFLEAEPGNPYATSMLNRIQKAAKEK